MNNNTFFDEETVDKIREHDKEQIAINRKKSSFNKINTAMDSYGKYSFENEELLRTYVGDKYEKFMTKKFNFWAFLFGPFYLLYRKMYLYGFLLSLFLSITNSYLVKINLNTVNIAESFLINVNWQSTGIILVFDLILSLLMGVAFNRLYIGTCVNDIVRLKREYPTLDTNELCRKKGGTSIGIAIVANIVIYIVVSIIMRFI